MSYHIISYRIISCHIISYHIISYHITSYHITSYHIISYHIISYHIISYHIIPYSHEGDSVPHSGEKKYLDTCLAQREANCCALRVHVAKLKQHQHLRPRNETGGHSRE